MIILILLCCYFDFVIRLVAMLIISEMKRCNVVALNRDYIGK